MTEHTTTTRIEPISSRHVRNKFCCGKAELDTYLQKFARQNDQKNIARTFVAVDAPDTEWAYYSISSASIEFAELPATRTKHLPEYPIPAALIARLAVDESVKGQGLGARLLVDALQRILAASAELAVKVIIVNAKDDEARAFYQHFGFIELPDQDLKLFLPIETVRQVF